MVANAPDRSTRMCSNSMATLLLSAAYAGPPSVTLGERAGVRAEPGR